MLAAKRDLRLSREIKRLGRYDGLIIDDLGYLQQSRDDMEVVFTLLAERYERGSVLMTSNLAFSKWEGIFKDAMMTAAAIDRLVHHSVIIELNIPSYRVEEAKKKQQAESQVERRMRVSCRQAKSESEESCGNAGAVESVESQKQASHSFHEPLGNLAKSRRDSHISTAPATKADGKVENQKQVSHFPTAPIFSLLRKNKTETRRASPSARGGASRPPKRSRVIVVDREK